VTIADLHEVAAHRLRLHDQRYTRGRRALIDVLAAAEAPLTILEVLDRGRSLAQSSAYRNLAVLEQAGVVHRIIANHEHARYELAQDLTEHHHHLICSSCGAVRDFTVPASLEAELERTLRRTATSNDFDADHHRLDLVGICAACR
jgi:Fe2+ or Zn2+ uptake regulation protein